MSKSKLSLAVPNWKEEAVNLKLTTDLSHRAIARSVNVSEPTTRRYLNSIFKDGKNIIEPIKVEFTGSYIGLFDLETSPLQCVVWGLWNQNIPIDRIIVDWKLLCFSCKWLHEDKIHRYSLHDYITPEFIEEIKPQVKIVSVIINTLKNAGLLTNDMSQDKVFKIVLDELDKNGLADGLKDSNILGSVFFKQESKVVQKLWDFLDKADVVIAHNAQRFDVRKAQAKFLEYNLPPTSPFKVVDTLKISKSCFGLTSQKLQYITKLLKKGSKLSTDMGLWLRCLAGDYSAYEYMAKYCDQDIVELQNIYLILAPWNSKMPNLTLHNDNYEASCNCCGSSDLIKYDDKFAFTNASKFELFRCSRCHKVLRGKVNLLSKEKRANTLMNVS